jgi:integrase
LIALRPVDIDLRAAKLSVATSKSGKPRSVVLTTEAQKFFESVIAGVPSHEIVFRRSDGEPWGHSHQFRPLRKACGAAKITPPVSFHILRHTHASRLAMAGVCTALGS